MKSLTQIHFWFLQMYKSVNTFRAQLMRHLPEISSKKYLADEGQRLVVNDGYVDVPVRKKVSRKVLQEPLVLVNVLGCGSPHRVRLEHVAEQAHHALVQVVRNRENAGWEKKFPNINDIKFFVVLVYWKLPIFLDFFNFHPFCN